MQNENGEDFLLADKTNLDEQPYHKEPVMVTWEKSSLRAWLNNQFINRAFSNEEKTAINQTGGINKNNQDYGTKGGKNTTDKIFLLSLSSSNLFSYAGTVSSDGTENEVPYNTKTRLVQK